MKRRCGWSRDRKSTSGILGAKRIGAGQAMHDQLPDHRIRMDNGTMTEIIGRIGFHQSRPERLALMRPDGCVSNWFARDDTMETVAAVIVAQLPGSVVQSDGIVTRPSLN